MDFKFIGCLNNTFYIVASVYLKGRTMFWVIEFLANYMCIFIVSNSMLLFNPYFITHHYHKHSRMIPLYSICYFFAIVSTMHRDAAAFITNN